MGCKLQDMVHLNRKQARPHHLHGERHASQGKKKKPKAVGIEYKQILQLNLRASLFPFIPLGDSFPIL